MVDEGISNGTITLFAANEYNFQLNELNADNLGACIALCHWRPCSVMACAVLGNLSRHTGSEASIASKSAAACYCTWALIASIARSLTHLLGWLYAFSRNSRESRNTKWFETNAFRMHSNSNARCLHPCQCLSYLCYMRFILNLSLIFSWSFDV